MRLDYEDRAKLAIKLRKLARELAKLYGWDIKKHPPNGVTTVLLDSADELESCE